MLVGDGGYNKSKRICVFLKGQVPIIGKSKEKEMKMTVISDNYGEPGFSIVEFEGDNETDILKSIADTYCGGFDEDDYGFEQPKDEEGVSIPLTAEQMMKVINDTHGDGCDFIIAIIKSSVDFYYTSGILDSNVVEQDLKA